MTIANEVFDYLYSKATYREKRAQYERIRYNRALLALSCQNYFFGAEFTNTTGAAGVSGVAQTSPVDRVVLVRGGGLNSKTLSIVNAGLIDPNIGDVNLQIIRSGSNKPQLSLNKLRSHAFVSDGQGQPWEYDWPVPIRLLPNELLQVRFDQVTATPAGTIYAVNFYGVAVDPNFNCDKGIIDSICRQIRDSDMRPLYLNLKTVNSGGAINFGAIGPNNIVFPVTDKAPAHLLVLGMRWNSSSFLPRDTTLRINSSNGQEFSREELVIKGFEFYNAPDAGWFRFTVPHLIREGQSLNAQMTSTTANAQQEFEGEINLLCVTV